MTAHTPSGDGVRQDLTVTFVSRRTVDCDGVRVRRLLVTDEEGETRHLLVAPDSDRRFGLRAGDRYHVRGLLQCTPPGETDTGTCPDCGGQLRRGRAVDTCHDALVRAVDELGIAAPFGVVDTRTTISRAVRDEVDDWRPMDATDAQPQPPAYVCRACGQHVTERELRGDTGGASAHELQQAPSAGATHASPARESLGMATGGAKDATTFRANVEAGYTPQPAAISDEGVFYDYHFETGAASTPETDALFAPRYATAVTDHPVTGETERYLSVGLDSTLSATAFERPRLDLVVALDVSGSMDSPFDDYYYDEHGRKQTADPTGETKLDAAITSLCALTRQLRADDRLGVVLYNSRAHVAKRLRDVGATDMDAIRHHVREITAGGGTNLEDGFAAAADLLQDGPMTPEVERRIVFMTDMMPNTGATDEATLTGLFEDAATRGVHTTFVGMGLDANVDLLDALSSIPGANHYVVNSADEFERRLGTEFDYMVTPLVYDLTLEVDAEGYEVVDVHGSPTGNAATGRLLHVGTLFPSPKQDGAARGGVVLVRVEPTADAAAQTDIELVASWTERDGHEHAECVTVDLPDAPETFAHDGVRKAIALARYARTLRAWASAVHDRADRTTGVDDWLLPDQRGEHERESVPLVVPDAYAQRFATLAEYLATERDVLGDDTLDQELDLLGRLCDAADTTVTLPEVTE